ncbi:MAG: hypothetical protein JWR38_5886 [Mucilaginibacter sp.]|nr:hypothetical protein [Mucilaginibacter sp.]
MDTIFYTIYVPAGNPRYFPGFPGLNCRIKAELPNITDSTVQNGIRLKVKCLNFKP